MSSVDEREAAERLIVALDVSSRREALELVERLDGTCRWFKVGMELYYAAGREMVEELVGRGYRVFLDLKLHDIPATVAGAVRSVGQSGASLLTVHASGGRSMMQAALEAAMSLPGGPRLLAVTVLTSMDHADLNDVGVGPAGEQVGRLALLAASAGIDGVVCSAQEVASLRGMLGASATLVIPGIRPEGAEVGDQRRIATPRSAVSSGATMLVVGRPITRAADPAAAAAAVLKEMAGAYADRRQA